MTKPFDSTLKDLLNVFAVDWADWLGPRIGLTADIEIEPLDVDLSTVQMSADKAFRLQPPAEGILHIEPQASWDGGFPGRLLRYSALLHDCDRFGEVSAEIESRIRAVTEAARLQRAIRISSIDDLEL